MANSLKQFITRKLKENVPLSEIKKDLKEKGYQIDEINKAVREAISGFNNKLPVHKVQIIILVVGVVIAMGAAVYFISSYRTAPTAPDIPKPQPLQTIQIPGEYEKMCSPFSGTGEKVGCRDAVPLFIKQYNGTINSVNRSMIVTTELSTGRNVTSDVWLLNTTLAEPITLKTPQGDMQRYRVIFAVDVNTGIINPYRA